MSVSAGNLPQPSIELLFRLLFGRALGALVPDLPAGVAGQVSRRQRTVGREVACLPAVETAAVR